MTTRTTIVSNAVVHYHHLVLGDKELCGSLTGHRISIAVITHWERKLSHHWLVTWAYAKLNHQLMKPLLYTVWDRSWNLI